MQSDSVKPQVATKAQDIGSIMMGRTGVPGLRIHLSSRWRAVSRLWRTRQSTIPFGSVTDATDKSG